MFQEDDWKERMSRSTFFGYDTAEQTTDRQPTRSPLPRPRWWHSMRQPCNPPLSAEGFFERLGEVLGEMQLEKKQIGGLFPAHAVGKLVAHMRGIIGYSIPLNTSRYSSTP